jgi:hypothetical protein
MIRLYRRMNSAFHPHSAHNSNPEKELYDRLHEAVQLDYVNSGPELLLDPMKLAEVVNRRLREIFQTELSRPLPTILLNEFTFFNLFC